MIPWRAIFRRLSADYGWTPSEIAQLTLAQAMTYYCATADPGQLVELAPREAARLQAQSAAERRAWEVQAARRLLATNRCR